MEGDKGEAMEITVDDVAHVSAADLNGGGEDVPKEAKEYQPGDVKVSAADTKEGERFDVEVSGLEPGDQLQVELSYRKTRPVYDVMAGEEGSVTVSGNAVEKGTVQVRVLRGQEFLADGSFEVE